MRGVLKEYAYLTNSLEPYYRSASGRKVYDKFLETVSAAYPQYLQELEGMADGAEVEFYKVSPSSDPFFYMPRACSFLLCRAKEPRWIIIIIIIIIIICRNFVCHKRFSS